MQGIKKKSNLTIGVTTIAFSSNEVLVSYLTSIGFKEVKVNKEGRRFSRAELITFLKDCDIAIVGLDTIDSELLLHLPKLKVISKYGVGLDNIDINACDKNGIEILHKKGVNRRSVSEMALGFMLGLSRNLYYTSNLLKNGQWKKNGGRLLTDKKIGIIGVGNIGKDLISLLKPFSCDIYAHDIIDQKSYYRQNDITLTDPEFIFRNVDILTIHTPLTESTVNMVNRQTLSMMRPTSFLINTARAAIVNQMDLKWALQNNIIAGAAIDVYDTEPPTDAELLTLPNLINTPHIGGNAKEAVEAMGFSAIDNIIDQEFRLFSNPGSF